MENNPGHCDTASVPGLVHRTPDRTIFELLHQILDALLGPLLRGRVDGPDLREAVRKPRRRAFVESQRRRTMLPPSKS